jgi:FAD/FMN-containing dehydrogenase
LTQARPSRSGAVPPLAGTVESRRRHRAHVAKIERVVEQLRRHPPGRPLSLDKGIVSHQVPKPRDRKYSDAKIDVSALTEILEIDVHARTCTAEPGVTFSDLVDATLPFGLVPIIVPELRTITIGGAVAGCSIESMSFTAGGFHDTCVAYEVLTATGERLDATPDNAHRLTFQMMHGTFGTLGILSRLTFRLTAARPFVHVIYEHYASLAEFKAAVWRRFEQRDVDFMDGMIHAPDHHVLSLGRFVDTAPYANRYDWTGVYYQSTRTRAEDYLRTPHYFFRYDNGVTNVHPRSALGRLLLGRLMHSDRLLRLAQRFRRFRVTERPDVTVDLFVPFSRLDAFMAWYARSIAHYPIWVVPYRRVRDYEWLAPAVLEGVDDPLFVDLAIYGMKQPRGRNVYAEIERQLPGFRAVKTLISYNYYDEATFWTIWNRANYEAVKRVTDPQHAFRDLYDKTCRAARGLGDAAA